MGLEWVDVELAKEPAGRFLRIFVDKPTGVELNDLETYHKAVQPLFDDVDYDYMEVSSPGVDRPLKKPGDYARAVGEPGGTSLLPAARGSKAGDGHAGRPV